MEDWVGWGADGRNARVCSASGVKRDEEGRGVPTIGTPEARRDGTRSARLGSARRPMRGGAWPGRTGSVGGDDDTPEVRMDGGGLGVGCEQH